MAAGQARNPFSGVMTRKTSDKSLGELSLPPPIGIQQSFATLEAQLKDVVDACKSEQAQKKSEIHYWGSLLKYYDQIETTAPSQLQEVADALESGHTLDRKMRNRMARTLTRVKERLCRVMGGVKDGISSILQTIQDGSLLPVTSVTKGYKALQENFDELLHEMSQLTVLQDLATKCFAKGLITESEMSAAFEEGNRTKKAKDFLQLIRIRIKRDAKAYDTFLGILSTQPAYHNLFVLAGGEGGG